jgi:Predicted glycosylase
MLTNSDISIRFEQNPLLSPADLQPSTPGLEIACLLNPGVFRYQGKTWLIVRVAERPPQREGTLSFPVLKPEGGIEIITLPANDPDLDASDPRVINFRGVDYLTTLSHFRLLSSQDGITFREEPGYGPLWGKGIYETFGIEDCRVSQLDTGYYLTFTAVSPNGVAVGLSTTQNWQDFMSHGLIFPPHNKDCALFEAKIGGYYYAFHRPSSVDLGGNYIWLARSPNGIHWGEHKLIARTRSGYWDSRRVGAGAAPIRTDRGWLAIYHGADANHRYCLGALLLDLEDPSIVLGRSEQPIMEPTAPYETTGFFGHVVFTNGHVVDGDRLTIYYGAADEHVCGAHFSIREILDTL